MIASSVRRARVFGMELAYRVVGTGPACFALHGGPGLDSGDTILESLTPLADRLTLIAPDLRGSGLSADVPIETLTHEQLARDLEELRRQLGLDQVNLIAEAYGGFIALEYARRFSERVRTLTLLNTSGSGGFVRRLFETASAYLTSEDASLLARALTGELADEHTFRRALVQWHRLVMRDLAASPEWPFAIPIRLETHNAFFGRAIPKYDVLDELAVIGAPAKVLHGEENLIIRASDAVELSAALSSSELITLPGVAHSVWTQAGRVHEEIIELILARDL